jgi:periplasmic protein TonB
MTAGVIEKSELRRWATCAAVVLGLHAAAAAALMTWHEPVLGVDGESDAIVIDLSAFVPPNDTTEDLPPGPVQQEAEAPPPPEEQKVEQKPEEKVDVPPTPVPSEVTLPPPEPVNPEPPKPIPPPEPPAPATTAPPRPHASRAQIQSWYGRIVTQLERHKSYPRMARERGENGVAQLAFSIDRQGRVVSSAIVRSSGYAALDEETIATVRRAQPFPPPPPGMDGATFDFTVPVRFNIR